MLLSVNQGTTTIRMAILALLSLCLTSCFQPPYNHFEEDKRPLKRMFIGAGLGTGMGALVGSIVGTTGAGAAVGGVVGTLVAVKKNSRASLIKEIESQDIQFIQYGDTFTLVVPTDRYFLFNSPRINDICYPGLLNIIKLLKHYPNTPIYVAGFTDSVGSKHHKKMLSQARAEAMLTFLWAHNINAQRLHAEGYEDKHDVGDNRLIRGSAYNRRLEIQWLNTSTPLSLGSLGGMKSIGVMK